MADAGTVTYLDTAPDVIAFRMNGQLTRASFDPLFERLNASFAAHDKTHLYIEVEHYGGIALADVVHYAGQALSMFTKLDRLGSIAVVTDEAWIRTVAKFESAILPHVTYNTFTLAEGPAALEWVKRG